MKKKVNIHCISRIFDPLFSLSDQEIDNLNFINFNNEVDSKLLFKNNIVDNFHKYGPISREIFQNTLCYILFTKYNKYTFYDLFPCAELPVEAPNDINLFFAWLWESLFPGEQMIECKENEFVISNDYNAPNSVYIK